MTIPIALAVLEELKRGTEDDDVCQTVENSDENGVTEMNEQGLENDAYEPQDENSIEETDFEAQQPKKTEKSKTNSAHSYIEKGSVVKNKQIIY